MGYSVRGILVQPKRKKNYHSNETLSHFRRRSPPEGPRVLLAMKKGLCPLPLIEALIELSQQKKTSFMTNLIFLSGLSFPKVISSFLTKLKDPHYQGQWNLQRTHAHASWTHHTPRPTIRTSTKRKGNKFRTIIRQWGSNFYDGSICGE